MLFSQCCYQSVKEISLFSLSLSSSFVGFDLSFVSRICLLEVRLSISFSSWIGRLYLRRRYMLASVKRRLLQVSVPASQSQSLKIVCTVGSC